MAFAQAEIAWQRLEAMGSGGVVRRNTPPSGRDAYNAVIVGSAVPVQLSFHRAPTRTF